MLDDTYVTEKIAVNIETMELFEFERHFRAYEEKLLSLLNRRKFRASEEVLMDFCMKIIKLPETEQLFIARLFFTSFVTNLIRTQASREKLPSSTLANAYRLIFKIEKWDNIAAYMLHLPMFVKTLKTDIIIDYLIFRGNEVVQGALKLIHHHLKSNELSVNWLAKELNVSSTHLTNLFKQYFDIGASQYIAQKRIESIIKLLNQSNKCLHSIRKQYGFNNHSHFIQFFKRHTGLTPLQYLQKHVH